MARIAGISRICDKQQGSHSNKSVTIHGKLWKGAKNRRGYKEKREGRKGNRVHGNDEKGIRRSRGGVEKSTGGHEKAGRLRKERDRGLEKRK